MASAMPHDRPSVHSQGGLFSLSVGAWSRYRSEEQEAHLLDSTGVGVGLCDLEHGTYTGLNSLGSPIVECADPLFIHMARQGLKQLAKVPGIQVEVVVESLWTDPFGGFRVTYPNGERQNFWIYAWDGNKTTWPPSRD